MPRDGSGNYQAPAGQPVQTGTTISSTVFNAFVQDIVNALTASVSRDGQTTPIANLPMGGFKHTGVADGTSRNQYASVAQLQDDTQSLVGSVAGSNTITGSLNPAISAYANGMTLTLIPALDNSGAATLALNGLSAKNINKYGTQALTATDLKQGVPAFLVYASGIGSGEWVLENPRGIPAGQVSGLGTLATQNGTFSNAALINIINTFATAQFLTNPAGGERLRLTGTAADPYVSWYKTDGVTRLGYLQGLQVNGLLLNSELGALSLTASTVVALTGTDVTFNGTSMRNAALLNAGVLADARVQQSNVTQYQAALSIATSQVSGALPIAQGGTGTTTGVARNISGKTGTAKTLQVGVTIPTGGTDGDLVYGY